MGLYTEEDLSRWTREALDKYVRVDVVSLLPVAEIPVDTTWNLESLLDSERTTIEAFCKDNKVIFMDIIQNHLVVIPEKYLMVEKFELTVPSNLEHEIKHVIGTGGKNIRNFIEKVNYVKGMPQQCHFAYGRDWLLADWYDKKDTPYNKVLLSRVDVSTGKAFLF